MPSGPAQVYIWMHHFILQAVSAVSVQLYSGCQDSAYNERAVWVSGYLYTSRRKAVFLLGPRNMPETLSQKSHNWGVGRVGEVMVGKWRQLYSNINKKIFF